MNDSNFDGVADQYCNSIKPIPKEYSNLIIESFDLDDTKNVVELGCGNGDLSIALASSGCSIQAVDISSDMIELAKEYNNHKNISYVCKNVFDLKYPPNSIDLFLSYESIHLFHPLNTLLNSCFDSLSKNGFICMGWCEYNWETPLRNIIVSTFEKNGVSWGTWGFSKHYPFFDLINKNNKFDTIVCNHINSAEDWSPEEITNYLLSISKSLGLDDQQKQRIKAELLHSIYDLNTSFDTYTKYCIAFAKKNDV